MSEINCKLCEAIHSRQLSQDVLDSLCVDHQYKLDRMHFDNPYQWTYHKPIDKQPHKRLESNNPAT